MGSAGALFDISLSLFDRWPQSDAVGKVGTKQVYEYAKP